MEVSRYMIINSYDDKTEPLISLKEFYGEKKKIVSKCIITFSKVIYDFLIENNKCTIISEYGGCNGKFPIYSFYHENEKIAFYLSPLGSTGAAQTAIEVNWLTGADQFIMFGSCGSLAKEKTNGKFIIPTEAYRDEGMSYHYAPAADYIKIKNSDKLAKIFESLNIPYVQGRVWTTDAMLRETKGQVALRKAEGCIGVEMELAGVQSICDFYGFELYNFLQCGDVLLDNAYDVSGLKNANHDLKKIIIALELIKLI